MIKSIRVLSMKKNIIISFFLFLISHPVFADVYSDLRYSLQERMETEEKTKAAIARELNVPYGTLYAFLTKEGSSSPSVLEKYKSYLKKQTSKELILRDTPLKSTVIDNTFSITIPQDRAPKTLIQETMVVLPRKISTSVLSKYEDDYDSEEDDDWGYVPKEYPRTQRHHGKDYVAFFRGVHFFYDTFPAEERVKFLNEKQIGEGVFSTAVLELI